jgi:hypothetical protein
MSTKNASRKNYKRNSKGRFVRGTRPGPGRPRKKPLNEEDVPLWSYNLLRAAWLLFKIANAYNQLELLKCKCGNDDPSQFDYKMDSCSGKLRARCKKCGCWLDFREKHSWLIEHLPEYLTPEERRQVALQRRAS